MVGVGLVAKQLDEFSFRLVRSENQIDRCFEQKRIADFAESAARQIRVVQNNAKFTNASSLTISFSYSDVKKTVAFWRRDENERLSRSRFSVESSESGLAFLA